MLMFLRKITKNKKGYTLTELIVVIAILGILASAATPSLMGYLKESKVEADKVTAATIHDAIKFGIARKTIVVDASGAITSDAATVKAAIANKLPTPFPTPQQDSTYEFYVDKTNATDYKLEAKAAGGDNDLALN